MTELLLNFNKKVREMNRYFRLVRFLDDKQHIADFRITPELQATLKTNCYLLLYNLVEGSIVEGLEAIFVDIDSQNISFDQLKDNYKEMWLKYQYQLVKLSKSKGDKRSESILGKKLPDILHDLTLFKILKYTDKSGDIFTGYKSYLKVLDSPDFSGNLDAKKIREIAKEYGFTVPEKCDELVVIKNFRNHLAHGEKTFSEVGQKRTISELIEINILVIGYLRNVLKNINQFIEKRHYLVQHE